MVEISGRAHFEECYSRFLAALSALIQTSASRNKGRLNVLVDHSKLEPTLKLFRKEGISNRIKALQAVNEALMTFGGVQKHHGLAEDLTSLEQLRQHVREVGKTANDWMADPDLHPAIKHELHELRMRTIPIIQFLTKRYDAVTAVHNFRIGR